MAFPLSHTELEKEIKALFSSGLSGNMKDFLSWVQMEVVRKFKDQPNTTLENVKTVIDQLHSQGDILTNPLDLREYLISEKSSLKRKINSTEKYIILGALNFNPMQYVRARLDYFLNVHNVNEDLRIDLCIATVEAVENSAKYGDGLNVEIIFQIDKSKVFTIEMVNTVKDFNIEDDILRGKFSSTATLMRGMMVMQKLFDVVDLDISDNRNQAYLKASRKLT